MNMRLTDEVIKDQLRSDLPQFSSGDTIKIHYKIQDGNKFRIQTFEGVVIKLQGSGIAKSVTVRKISNGTGVERNFPLHSPLIEAIEVVKYGRVRRAKIYYMRERTGKAARIKEVIVKKEVKTIKKAKTDQKIKTGKEVKTNKEIIKTK